MSPEVKDLRFNIFGKLIGVTGSDGTWKAYYVGTDGKHRPADFIVPHNIVEEELCEYLADLYHENATRINSKAVQLK